MASNRKESSVQFNLAELMRVEVERVEAERQARTKAAEQEALEAKQRQQARDEAAQHQRQKAALAAQEARKRQRDEDLHRARLDAEREATLLRARMEVEARARSQEAKQAHQRELALRDLDTQLSRLRRYRGSTFLASFVALAALVSQLGWALPSLSHARAAENRARQELKRAAAREAGLQSQISSCQAQVDTFHASVRAGTSSAPPS
ncbi:MAG: hypothetical protein OXR73_08050, partial [Myxococcales bacterium]|nr:hypothetical protein [Myxococcales bacterium]